MNWAFLHLQALVWVQSYLPSMLESGCLQHWYMVPRLFTQLGCLDIPK